jgi:hypothetical protein
LCLLIWVISRLRVLWRFPSSCRYRCCAPLCLLIWVIGRLRVLLRFPSSCRCRCCAPLCLLIWVISRLSVLWCLPRSCRCRCRCSFPLRSALCIIIGDLRCSLPSRCRYRCSFPCRCLPSSLGRCWYWCCVLCCWCSWCSCWRLSYFTRISNRCRLSWCTT